MIQCNINSTILSFRLLFRLCNF